jgi:hypothetical protein
MDTRRVLLAGVLCLSMASCKTPSGSNGPGANSDGGGGDDGGGDDGGGSHDADSDGDGLSDWDEKNTYHTDPTNPDSDGDSYSDGDEVLEYKTNPLNEYNRPYIGDYKIGDCAEYPDKATTGPSGSRLIDIGAGAAIVALYEPSKNDILKNEKLVDQFGEQVDLYSFCGVSLDLLFIQWNQVGSTPEYAALTCWIKDMVNVETYYRDYGYQLVIVLTQNSDTQLPTKDDVSALASMLLGKDSDKVPVLASNDESMGSMHAWFEKDFHEPTLVHIGPELNVLAVDDDDCAGSDRDPGKYMTVVPEDLRWANPDPTCEPLDAPYCACPAPRCIDYCGADNCPLTY